MKMTTEGTKQKKRKKMKFKVFTFGSREKFSLGYYITTFLMQLMLINSNFCQKRVLKVIN